MTRKRNSKTRNTVINLVSGLGSEVLVYVLSFVTRTVFINTLGVEYLGINGLFANILMLLSLTDLGIGAALNYRLYKPLKDHNTDRIIRLMNFYKKAYFYIGVVILFLGICVIPLLKYCIKEYASLSTIGVNAIVVFLLFLMQSVSSYWFSAYKSAIIRADQKEYMINVIGYVIVIISNLLEIGVLLIFHNFMLYVTVTIVVNIATGLINAALANRIYPFLKGKSSLQISKRESHDIFRDCKAIFLFSINTVVVKATDNLVLAAFVGLNIVGIYANYLMIYNAIKKIIKKIIRSAQASMGHLFASSDNDEKYHFFRLTNFVMFMVCGLPAVCIAVLINEFIEVWIGDSFVIPQPFPILMAVELYLIGLKVVLEQIRDVTGIFQRFKWPPIVGMVLNLGLSILLVQKFGIYGVVVGTIIAELLTTILFYPYIIYKNAFARQDKIAQFYIENGYYLLALIVSGFLCKLFNKYAFATYGWLSLVGHSFCNIIIILGVMVAFNCHSILLKNLLQKTSILIKRNNLPT